MRFKVAALVLAVVLAALTAGCEEAPRSASVLNQQSHEEQLREFFGEYYDIPETAKDELTYHAIQTGGIVVTDYNGTDKAVKIPKSIDGETVKRVDLRYCYKNIKALILPDTVEFVRLANYEEIMDYLCNEDITPMNFCSYYESPESGFWVIDKFTGMSDMVRISDEMRDFRGEHYKIATVRFRDKYRDIKHLVVSDDIRNVFAGPYEDILSYESEVDAELTGIVKNGRYYDNISVERMNVPAAVSQEAGLAFAQSTLKAVYIPDNFAVIPSAMFQENRLLESVTLCGEKVEISANAFYDCENLQSLDFSGVASIGGEAFYGCEKLENIP